MKQLTFGLKILVMTLSVQASLVMAHHAGAPHYDTKTIILIEDAVITDFRMVNPHSFVYFDVIDEDNEMVNWRCEMRSSTVLKRRGWTKETLAEGLIISVKGKPAWREDNHCLLETIIFGDGTEVGQNDVLIDAEPDRHLAQTSEAESGDKPVENVHGQPVNISGDWLKYNTPGVKVTGDLRKVAADPENGFDVSEAGFAAAEGYDPSFDDPSLHCHPINILQGWVHDSHVNRITQLENSVVLTYGYVDFVRTIYLNEDHPDQIEPSTGGHSIGTWEGDVLTVDTVGLLPGVLANRTGILHSDQLHVTEKYYLDEANGELVREFTLEDPEYLNTPYHGQDRQKASAVPYTPYDCVDLTGTNSIRLEN